MPKRFDAFLYLTRGLLEHQTEASINGGELSKIRTNRIMDFYTSIISCFRFLLQCLTDLDSSLKKLNSRLFVIKGQPAEVLPKLFKVSIFKLFLQISRDLMHFTNLCTDFEYTRFNQSVFIET